MRLLLMIFGLAATVVASDNRCTILGGTCKDYRNNVCLAGYKRGVCDGDSNRRCCLPCNTVCSKNEHKYSSKDGGCSNSGGKCRHNTNYCNNAFASGKCGGPSSRQCCVQAQVSYGNILNVDTTGASCSTSQQDGLSYCGVLASNRMALTDSLRMLGYKGLIMQAAAQLHVDASIIAGIISRETRGGNVLKSNGFGNDGHGYGLMQVDNRFHTLQGLPYSLEHIKQGTGILIDMINGVKKKHPTWTQDKALKGGISAYNAGVGNVDSYENMDVGTTGNDYGNDVVARSKWYKNNGY